MTKKTKTSKPSKADKPSATSSPSTRGREIYIFVRNTLNQITTRRWGYSLSDASREYRDREDVVGVIDVDGPDAYIFMKTPTGNVSRKAKAAEVGRHMMNIWETQENFISAFNYIGEVIDNTTMPEAEGDEKPAKVYMYLQRADGVTCWRFDEHWSTAKKLLKETADTMAIAEVFDSEVSVTFRDERSFTLGLDNFEAIKAHKYRDEDDLRKSLKLWADKHDPNQFGPEPAEALRASIGTKIKTHLVPYELIVAAAIGLNYGEAKYAARNFENGLSETDLLMSIERHTRAIMDGEIMDEDSNLPHFALLTSSVAMYVACELRGTIKRDLPPPAMRKETLAYMSELGQKMLDEAAPVTRVTENKK